MKKKGFTLIELMVVVMIIGILAAIGIPYYSKTIESSKATDALAILNSISTAQRMYSVDNTGTWTFGNITTACNSTNCSGFAATSQCRLVACNYVAQQPWNTAAYDFYTCDPTNNAGGGCCGGSAVACAKRKNTASSPYINWGYRLTQAGACTTLSGDTPSCTNM